jgi:hypothetical protein
LNAELISPAALVNRFRPAFVTPKGWRKLPAFAA